MADKLDSSQRDAVYSKSNTVVTAGAGSGKTTVLAKRFVHLIASGSAEVDGILTLTFTRKAAAEMYERIYRLLLHESGHSKDPGQKERIRRAVADFDEARISTLDSFCGRVVRGGSARFGISGDFRQDDYASAQLNAQTALRFLLEYSKEGPLGDFLTRYGMEPVLHQLLIPLADEELHMAREYDFPGIFSRQRDFLYHQAEEIVRRMQEVRQWFLSPELPADKKSLQKTREVFEKASPPGELFYREDWKGLLHCAGLPIKNFGGAVKDPVLLEGKEKIREWQEAVKELDPILILFCDEQMYRGLYELLGEYQSRIRKAKQISGVLTFRDVVEMAVLLLREDPGLRDFYKRRFSHIMIDEFQDNNDLQRQLLFLLAEKRGRNSMDIPAPEDLAPGKLFFVGDEKQSIYKFRGADVRVLKQLQDQMERSSGTSLPLMYNYRSHSVLIDFFNGLFSRIMRPADENPKDFEARFLPLTAPGRNTGFTPLLQLYLKPFDSEESVSGDEEVLLSSSEAEAWTVARFIKETVEKRQLMVRDGTKADGTEIIRPASYDDFAILMRSSGNQIHFEKYLRRLKVPYSVQSIRSLFQEAPVNDIYQFLQLLIYPEDMNAYAALLRSPFVHLSDDTVFRILLDAGEEGARGFSHTGDEDVFTSEKERAKYLQAREQYRILLALSSREKTAGLIRFLWYEAGYRYTVLRNPDYHLYLEFYDALIALARRSDSRGENLPVFLDFIRENLGDYKKLEDLDLIPRESGGVQLLSIHKSKGLEFPVVILADMGNSGAGDRGRLFEWDEEYGLVLNPAADGPAGRKRKQNYFSRMAAERRKQQDTAELKRLLYVACTRARDHLILSGYQHSRNRNLRVPEEQNVLLNMVLQAFGWDGESSPLDLGTPLGCIISRIHDYKLDEVNRLSSFSRGIAPEEAARIVAGVPLVQRSFPRREWTPSDLNRMYREYPQDSRDAAEKRRGEGALEDIQGDVQGDVQLLDRILLEHTVSNSFGELVHSTIEYKISRKPGKVPLPGALLSLPRKESELLKEYAGRMAGRFFDSKLGREVMTAAEKGEAFSELPFLLQLESAGGSHLIRGQIDLLLLRPEHTVVIDFKTDHEEHPGEYAAQLEAYRRAAAQLYGRPVVAYLVYVRTGHICEANTSIDLENLISAW